MGFAVRRSASEMTEGLAGEVQMSGRRRLPRKGPPSVCREGRYRRLTDRSVRVNGYGSDGDCYKRLSYASCHEQGI